MENEVTGEITGQTDDVLHTEFFLTSGARPIANLAGSTVSVGKDVGMLNHSLGYGDDL